MKLSLVLMLTLSFLTFLAASAVEPDAKPKPGEPAWRSLFDSKTLAGWKSTNYGGEGEVAVEDGCIVLNIGNSMTGITYQKKDLPKNNYEIRCEAKRADGRDFFCGLTFPVVDSHCSLIVGGWGGAIVGLSSINGHDASENETTKYMKFENDRWYKFRVRVTSDRIEAWIDEQPVIDADIRGCKISTRNEVTLNQPLGFASYETKAVLRKIEVREVK